MAKKLGKKGLINRVEKGIKLQTVFRKDKKANEIICVFLDCPEGDDKLSAYSHLGQHFIVDYNYLKNCTCPASILERKELLKEIKAIGYSPIINNRITKKYMEVTKC